MSLAGVVDWETVGAESSEESLDARDDFACWGYVVLLVFHISSWRADYQYVSVQYKFGHGTMTEWTG